MARSASDDGNKAKNAKNRDSLFSLRGARKKAGGQKEEETIHVKKAKHNET